jgi:pyruvate dehydrogenase E1 component
MNDSTPHPLLAQAATSPARDPDPQETAEWREAFEALAAAQGPARARQMLDELSRVARARRIGWQPELSTPYVNTIDVNEQLVRADGLPERRPRAYCQLCRKRDTPARG